jgi:hypothetical protein
VFGGGAGIPFFSRLLNFKAVANNDFFYSYQLFAKNMLVKN